jgi:hypothetical protein
MTTTARTTTRRPGQATPARPRLRPSQVPDQVAPAPGRPSRPLPAKPAGTGRQGPVTAPAASPAAEPARRVTPAGQSHSSRTPFILLVIGLLSGGMACLLVINTTLAAGSLQITKLQQDNETTSQRIAELQQQLATEQSPSSIQQRAEKLGMQTQPQLNFVDVRNGRRYTTSGGGSGPAVPGYTP